MTSKRLKVGIIGLGKISPRHIEDSIRQIKELELAAVCDTDKTKARETGKKYEAAWYTDYRDLINDKNIDVVSVCTPNGWHHKMGLAIAKSGKHCIMEKPISLTHKDGKKLVEAFKKSQGLLFPVLQVRYNPAVKALREYVQNGSLGKIYTGATIIRWTRPQEYFSDWHGDKAMCGGTLLTQGIHYLDVMHFVLGEVESVIARSGTVAHKINMEDTVNAIIDFKSGARVNLEFTVCAYPHNLECSLAILGENGSIKIGGSAMNVCELWEVKDKPRPYIPEGLAPNKYAGGSYVGSCPNHYFVYANLVNTIMRHKPSDVRGSDALSSLRIIDALMLSSKTGKTVRLSQI